MAIKLSTFKLQALIAVQRRLPIANDEVAFPTKKTRKVSYQIKKSLTMHLMVPLESSSSIAKILIN